MHQEIAQARSDSLPDLAGYGDLSSFDPSATRRKTSDLDEHSAIAMIMGDEDFVVGDGTLEFPLRDEDRNILSASEDERPEPVVATAPRALEQNAQEPSFAPIEEEIGDAGDEVARQAVLDAFARLEQLAGLQSSQESSSDEEQEASAESELTEEDADELLGAGDSTFGGMGSSFESDAPTPFALPKLPGSFETYVPPVSDAYVTAPEKAQSVEAHDSLERLESISEPIGEPRALFEEQDPQPATEVVSGHVEEFAPFEISSQEERKDEGLFDTRAAEVPSYARDPEPEVVMPEVAEQIDDLIPSPAARDDRAQYAYSQPAREEVPEIPAYSRARTHDEIPEQAHDPFAFESSGHEENAEEASNEEAIEEWTEDLEGEASYEEPAVATQAQGSQSFFQKNRNFIAVATIIGALMGGKAYMKHQAQMQEEAEPAAVTLPINRETLRPQVNPDLASILPQETVSPAPVNPTGSVQQPILPAPTAEVVPQLPEANPVEATEPPPNPTEAKLEELSERLAALEEERNKLREENEKLKASKKPAPSKPSAAPKKATPAKAETPAPSTPAKKPLPAIQYLGTFRDGDRLVAEVLVNGSLSRVKRGDKLLGAYQVDAVGDMSVTIENVVYAP